ncbi:hypothetical protein GCM10011608_09240 [Micromonospora sonchi]|uniref:Uncharacterized protein n=1 Tax=Micromonospora sonchi TaxID=1763543 RepID=A0A917WSY5_9ACTN|nr:hypothetical protein [Micromonospora sonchi]GGM26589.1 hypothetical protein GCM10011608_09240 [Micromonospora sonchi]
MRWLHRVAIWWRSRSWLAARVRELEALEARRLREQRAETERRDAKEAELRDRIMTLLETQARQEHTHVVSAAELLADLEQERVWGNGYIARINAAHQWAGVHLPADVAAELCAVLSPTMPDVEESPNAVVV